MKSRAQRGLNPIMSCEGSHTLIFIQYYKNSILYLLGGLLSSKQSLLDLKQKSQARLQMFHFFFVVYPGDQFWRLGNCIPYHFSQQNRKQFPQ